MKKLTLAAVAALGLTLVVTRHACSDDARPPLRHTRARPDLERFATRAVELRRDGHCPDRAEVVRSFGLDEQIVRPFMVVCGEIDGSDHLLLLDPDVYGSYFVAWR